MGNQENAIKMTEALAKALREHGWNAYFIGAQLRVAEDPNLRCPTVHGAMYIWRGHSAKKPETIARLLDRFLRLVGRTPSLPGPLKGPAVKKSNFAIKTYDGSEQRSGYALGRFATHKEPGSGSYFWKITHVPTGMSVCVSPPPETKDQAIAVLEQLDNGTHPRLATIKSLLGSRW